MAKNRFVGIAYWTVSTVLSDWLAKAVAILTILETDDLASIQYTCLPAGDQMTIRFGDEQCQILVNNGKGRGAIRESQSAGCFVVCLVALRKALGDLVIVSDAQESVSTHPRQSDPLYSADWQRIHLVAQRLGLIGDEVLVSRHASVFTNVF